MTALATVNPFYAARCERLVSPSRTEPKTPSAIAGIREKAHQASDRRAFFRPRRLFIKRGRNRPGLRAARRHGPRASSCSLSFTGPSISSTNNSSSGAVSPGAASRTQVTRCRSSFSYSGRRCRPRTVTRSPVA